jgi:predicted pyridoxine 5'-phosphate oxidase superfamily flavin-nucleotide-binding protein
MLSNPHVGLIYLVPGRTETLRINGRAKLVRDAPFFGEMVVKGHRPLLALIVDIEQIFFHCPKAFLRSSVWKPETWAPYALPSHASIVNSVQESGKTLGELERHYGPAYADRLYC